MNKKILSVVLTVGAVASGALLDVNPANAGGCRSFCGNGSNGGFPRPQPKPVVIIKKIYVPVYSYKSAPKYVAPAPKYIAPVRIKTRFGRW